MFNTKFDAFLSHNSDDKPAVIQFANELKKLGFNPWLDAWHLVAGEPWLPAIDRALRECGACAVIVGPHGLGNVHEDEMWVALQHGIESKRSDRRFRVIPVLLPNATRGDRSKLPTFLAANTWVEFSRSIDDPAALEKLARASRGADSSVGVTVKSGECPYRGRPRAGLVSQVVWSNGIRIVAVKSTKAISPRQLTRTHTGAAAERRHGSNVKSHRVLSYHLR